MNNLRKFDTNISEVEFYRVMLVLLLKFFLGKFTVSLCFSDEGLLAWGNENFIPEMRDF